MAQVSILCDHRLIESEFVSVLDPLQLVILYRLLREGKILFSNAA